VAEGDRPRGSIAAALNKLPKHVAARTLQRVDWAGSTLLRDVAGEVPGLKARYARELQVPAARGRPDPAAGDLIDELNLLVFPVTLGGGGKRLFGAGTVPTAFELLGSRTTGKGVVISTYRRAGLPTFADVGA
jgi:hypothetical protein